VTSSSSLNSSLHTVHSGVSSIFPSISCVILTDGSFSIAFCDAGGVP